MRDALAAARFAALRETQREIEQPLGCAARDHHRLLRVVMRDDAFAERGEQAFGRFADHHEIDAVLVGADNRARHAGQKTAGPHAGIQIEDETQLDLRRDLGAVRITNVRQSAGAEKNRVGFLAQPRGALRERRAGLFIRGRAGGRFGETEFQPWCERLHLAQHFERGRGDLRADTVAADHGNMEGVVGAGHVSSL